MALTSIAIARSGRWVAVRHGGGIDVVETSGSGRRTATDDATAVAWVGDELWWADGNGCVHRDVRGQRVSVPDVTGVTAIVANGDGAVLVAGDRAWLAERTGSVLAVPHAQVLALHGRRMVIGEPAGASMITAGRDDRTALWTRGTVLAAAVLFGGRAVGLWVREPAGDALIAVTTTGQRIRRIEAPRLERCAFAETAGTVLGHDGTNLRVFDLRYGHVRETAIAAAELSEIALDESARHVVLARGDGAISLVTLDELFVAPPAPVIAEPASAPAPVAEPVVEPAVIMVPEPRPRAPAAELPRASLEPLLDLVAARAELATAIAEGQPGDAAAETLLERAAIIERSAEPCAFSLLARELGLSSTAAQILACAAAPRLRADIARQYASLARAAGVAVGTEHFLALLVEPEDTAALARELAGDSRLVRTGALSTTTHAGERTHVVDDLVIERLHGLTRAVDISEVTRRRIADRALGEIVAPDHAGPELLAALREARARVLVRGRRGSGRHTIVAAVAAELDLSVAEIDVRRLLGEAALAPALARELCRARLAGAIPVVSGLEPFEKDAVGVQLEAVLARHLGPVVVRTSLDGNVPLAAERVEIVLPPLTLGQRLSMWRRALAARCETLGNLELLAARFRFGPGTIVRIAEQLAHRLTRSSLPAGDILEQIARQHVTGRLEGVATRITHLATWDQVTLPEDMRDSVLEFIGRMRFQRKVYEQWGFEQRLGTARGLTALFYGPPGTGKTLVAGLVGRELGLDVWRIDLARVMSKWVGETEKKLAEVFEAAEEGQVLLLFDEADSLFQKRQTEAKSSSDRFANMETNYLLQRLDSFEGVAILTTNLEGSIDPAFKRRLTMRLYFPFPDAAERARLWAVHVPPELPFEGQLDFEDLGETFPISGGYIRNCALRAAFLAAQEQRPLTQAHLVRALQLEYRELGKLWPSGRME